MAYKHTRTRPHAEFRYRSQSPMPAVGEVEQQLVTLLSPSLLAPGHGVHGPCWQTVRGEEGEDAGCFPVSH